MVSSFKSKAKKIVFMCVIPFKLANRPSEFNLYIGTSIEEILGEIGEIQSCFEIENKRKIMILKFKSENSKKIAKTKEIKFLVKAIEFAESLNYSEEYKFITLSSYNGLGLCEFFQKSYQILSNIGEFIDIMALKYTKI
ncbi:hypothetical protein AYI69_g1403 [Smittium culicis]|uniref:Uncharacterized protein n=1 Tax=Smittium culicis TaxID=133412 RepID=A0A1R1YQE2_9FUNG|nr:hypothetical protein AYI69_g1403 [Smittium culicis]